MSRPRIAIILPTLNEADRLAEILPRLLGRADDILISDGGSVDETSRIAADAGVRFVQGPAGRGGQLRRGVDAVDADVFVFLHADTVLPAGAIESIRRAVREGYVAGGFRVRFDAPGPLYALGSYLVNLRTRWTRLPLGDQVQWATREAYALAGGFPDWPVLEDLDLMRRLKRVGPIALLGQEAVTSARRYQRRGVARTVAKNWMIWLLFLLGVSPYRLSLLYPPERPSSDPARRERPRRTGRRGR